MDLIQTLQSSSTILDKKFTLTHVGLMNADRNPISLWKAISEICKENADFAADYQIQFVGKNSKRSSRKYSKISNRKCARYWVCIS